jgi:hypothetical protein
LAPGDSGLMDSISDPFEVSNTGVEALISRR